MALISILAISAWVVLSPVLILSVRYSLQTLIFSVASFFVVVTVDVGIYDDETHGEGCRCFWVFTNC